MRYSQSLRLRFTAASVLLVLGITTLFSWGVYLGQEQVDDQLLVSLMQREVDEYARMYRRDHDVPPPRSSLLHSYVVVPGEPGDLPSEFLALPPGIHHDILLDGHNYQVANFTLEDKRFYLAYDITQIETSEAWLKLCLVLGVLTAGAGAGFVGWRLSRMVISPVSQLAEQIRGRDPLDANADFERRFPGFEVGAIAHAFDSYIRRIGEFISRERAFTEDASHELRTPVTVIGTAAERIAEDPALPGSLLPVIRRIQRAGRQMQTTTQALLFMAREDEPPASAMERALIVEVIEQAVEDIRHLLVGKPVQLETCIEDDAKRLIPRGLGYIVVSNLLHNAISHTSSGRIVVSLRNGWLTVEDTGDGVPAAELPRIFERHYRGAHSSGQGLGLHIVKRICDRLGWGIEVKTAPEAGTRFTVRMVHEDLTNS